MGKAGDAAQPGPQSGSGRIILDQPFQLSPDELIAYIKQSAAESAAADARERLNFFFTLIGIVVGLAAGAAAGVFFMLQASLEKTATEVSGRQIEALRGTLGEDLKRQFTDLKTENDRALQDAVGSILLLSLIGAEANSLTSDPRGSRQVDRDRMIGMLEARKAEILALSGPTRELAFRRLEDMVAAFAASGDLFAAERLIGIYPDDLLAIDGVRATYANLLVERLLAEPGMAQSAAATIDGLLARPYDRRDLSLGDAMRTLSIVRDALARGLDQAAIVARLSEAEAESPGYLGGFRGSMEFLRDRYRSEGLTRSATGEREVAIFIDAGREAARTQPAALPGTRTAQP